MHPQVELLIQFATAFAVAMPLSVVIGALIIANSVRRSLEKPNGDE